MDLFILEHANCSSKNSVSNAKPPCFSQLFPVHFSGLTHLTSFHPHYIPLSLYFLHLPNLEFKPLQPPGLGLRVPRNSMPEFPGSCFLILISQQHWLLPSWATVISWLHSLQRLLSSCHCSACWNTMSCLGVTCWSVSKESFRDSSLL